MKVILAYNDVTGEETMSPFFAKNHINDSQDDCRMFSKHHDVFLHALSSRDELVKNIPYACITPVLRVDSLETWAGQ
jgi:hypothetical protein